MSEIPSDEFLPDEFGPDSVYQCPSCGGVLEYVASSDDYHRYECGCGVKLLVPKEVK